jgi:predicted glycoside hydrolase/deacetylase ChbG (UPF0249 family)
MLKGHFSADDWGLSPAVNEAILELAEAGLVRSVSVFANLPYTETGLERLAATGVELAAHVNFTLGRPLGPHAASLRGRSGAFHPFRAFLRRGFLGLLRRDEIEAEARAQLARLGGLCRIQSVNGHEHVHALPWMIAPLAAAARAHGVRRLRLMVDPSHKASCWTAACTRRLLRREWGDGLEPTHYLFPTGGWSERRLGEKLAAAGGRPVVVHPAARDDFASLEFADGLRRARVDEFESLRRLR